MRLMCLIVVQASVFAMNWNEVLESHHELISDKSVVVRQYQAFSKSDTTCAKEKAAEGAKL